MPCPKCRQALPYGWSGFLAPYRLKLPGVEGEPSFPRVVGGVGEIPLEPPSLKKLFFWESPYRFLSSSKPFAMYIGGVGAGKSNVGIWKGVCEAIAYGRCSGMVVVQVYKNLADTILPLFEDLVVSPYPDVERGDYPSLLDHINKEERTAYLINGSRIFFRSADDPDILRGPNLSWFLLDEASQSDRYTWNMLIARLREQKRGDRPNMGFLTTTPRGRNWVWELFSEADPEKYDVVEACTLNNPFLPEAYKENLVQAYGETLFADQEIHGKFVNLSGALFQPSWFREMEPPPDEHIRYSVRGWDLATSKRTTADYTVGAKLSVDERGDIWIANVVRGRWEWPAAMKLICDTARKDGRRCMVAVERVGMQLSHFQELRDALAPEGYAVRDVDRRIDKAQAAVPIAGRMQQGHLFVVPNAPWFEALRNEFIAFDGQGRGHDDQVDAVANALSMIVAKRVLKPEILYW